MEYSKTLLKCSEMVTWRVWLLCWFLRCLLHNLFLYSFCISWNAPLSVGEPGNPSFSETRWETRWGGAAMQTEEWVMRGGRRSEWWGGRADVWGPPCLPTRSSSPLFPPLSASLPPALLQFLLFLRHVVSPSPSAVVSHASLSSSRCVSFLFSLFPQLSLRSFRTCRFLDLFV